MAPDDIVEMFSAFGPVAVRRMFGGAGIYAGDTMFALVADGVIYLKVAVSNAAAFEREGLEPFTYTTGKGQTGCDVLSAHAGPALRRSRRAGGMGTGCVGRGS